VVRLFYSQQQKFTAMMRSFSEWRLDWGVAMDYDRRQHWYAQRRITMNSNPVAEFELHPQAQVAEFDSSTRSKTYRVELATGKHFQISEAVYHLLDILRAPMTLSNLASAFEQRTGRGLALEQLQQLSEQLAGYGILVEKGATPAAAQEQTPAGAFLGLHYKRDFVPVRVLKPLARLMQVFFVAPAALVMVAVIAATHLLAYAEMGFPPNLEMERISWPLFYGIVLASIGLHELGHLAACHRYQCDHGPLGFGLYFFNPVFYVDVTAAWRLPRRQRAVVDIGGMYLQLLCTPLFWLLFQVTSDITYLLAIAVIDLMILGNLEPLMKLDGYWLLSDLTGVPNLHNRTGEAARRAWSWLLWRLGRRAELPAASVFGQWPATVRWVIFAYVALSMVIWPLLVLAMIPMVVAVVASYPALWGDALAALGEAMRSRDAGLALAQVQVLFLPTLMMVNLGYLLKTMFDRVRKARQGRKVSNSHLAGAPLAASA
jgi:putative peptide zinc metalloprotease protein